MRDHSRAPARLAAALAAASMFGAHADVPTRQPPAAPAVAPARTPPDDCSALLRPIVERHAVPGLAAALVTADDGLIRIGAAGVRRKGDATAVAPDDRFHLGSCTKAITATLCAVLVEQGALRWDSTLGEVFPDDAPAMHEPWKAVTLRQLLNNRSGTPANLDRDGLWASLWSHRGEDSDARRLLLRGVTAHDPEHPPGSKFLYSNAGFAIAGHMAETVTGVPYERLLRDSLLGPLGMTSAGFGAPGDPGVLDQPRGHDAAGRPVEPTADGRGADNPPAITPAGRVHASLADWAAFVRLHLQGAQGRPVRVGDVSLSPESFRVLHEIAGPDGEYAMGWARPERPWAGPEGHRRVLTHSGSNTLWYCVVWAAPERGFAALAACNTAAGGPAACDEAVAALIRAYTERGAGKD
ncbi:MAG: beta-lactamase family protein [Phycisphaerae bacterium]|nr:beta-lactamase family protein [Phycisphaerae bacterium]